MKNKFLNIIVSGGVLLISVSFAYFFLFFLPNHKQMIFNKEKDEQLLKKQIECRENGIILHEKEMSETKGAFAPAFKYSSKLNTCLYKGGWLTTDISDGTYLTRFIRDVYSNEEIVSYTKFTKDGKSNDLFFGGLVSQEEFEKQEKELFE